MIEIQDIFLMYGDSYRQKYKLPNNIHKAMSSIEKCRTFSLGAHADVCDECGYTKISYNSFLTSLYSREWIVYCKPPFKNAAYVVEYLGRYTHRVRYNVYVDGA